MFQTGRKEGDYTVVTLDNPDFTEPKVQLTPASTQWNGTMPRTITVTNSGFSVANGDFKVSTWDGDGPAKSNGVSVFRSVSDEDLPARPDNVGTYASDIPPAEVELKAHGLRVGYTPLLVRTYQVEPNRSTPVEFTTSRVKLDPNVKLIPIEAVVVFHEKDADGKLDFGMENQRVNQQLAFWDHLPIPQTTNITDGQYGEIKSTIHAMQWYKRDAEGNYRVGTQTAPDMIWSPCNVQFRLVNYFEIKVPTRNVYPARKDDPDTDKYWPLGTYDDEPLRDNIRIAKQDPRHMDETVMVVFMARAAFHDAPEVGRAIEDQNAIGVSLNDNRSSDGVVGHELGHLSGLRHGGADIKDANGKFMWNVMVDPGPGIRATEAECNKFRQWAERFIGFWTKPRDPHQQ